MSIVPVQVNSVGEEGGIQNEVSLFFPSANAAGNTIVVVVNQGDGQGSPPVALSCTDFHPFTLTSNSYNLAGSAGTPKTPRYTTLFYSSNCVAGINLVTVTNYGASGLTMSMTIAEFPGVLAPDSGVLAEAAGTGWDAAWDTGAIITTAATESVGRGRHDGLRRPYHSFPVLRPGHERGCLYGILPGRNVSVAPAHSPCHIERLRYHEGQ